MRLERKSIDAEEIANTKSSEFIKKPLLKQKSCVFTSKPDIVYALSKTTILSSLNAPPPELDILVKNRTLMRNLIDKVNELIRENECTPFIVQQFSPLVNGIKEFYPQFQQYSMKFFSGVQKKRQSAKNNQVISTAACRIPMQQFFKFWDPFNLVIKEYSDRPSLPQSNEIDNHFASIRASLEVIDQNHSNKKTVNESVTQAVLSIESLCSRIQSNIILLFKGSSFPDSSFSTLNMHCNDVKSLSQIINEAFKNRFPQNGLSNAELSRMKTSIITSCNTIMSALRAAFGFPEKVKSLKSMINEINSIMKPVFDQLIEPFSIVRPTNESILVAQLFEQIEQEQKPKVEEIPSPIAERKIEDFVGVEPSKPQYDTPEQKVLLFLKGSLPLIGKTFHEVEDPWTSLLDFEKSLAVLKKKIRQYEITINEKSKIIDEKDQHVYDIEEKFRQREFSFNRVIEDHRSEIGSLKLQLKSITASRNTVDKEVNEKQNEIEKLISKGDPTILRDGLIKTGQIIAKHIGLSFDSKSLNDSQLIQNIFSIANQLDEKRSSERMQYENTIKELRTEIEKAKREKEIIVPEEKPQSDRVNFDIIKPVPEFNVPDITKNGRRKYTVREPAFKARTVSVPESFPSSREIPTNIENKESENSFKTILLDIGKKLADILDRNFIGTNDLTIAALSMNISDLLKEISSEMQMFQECVIDVKSQLKSKKVYIKELMNRIKQIAVISDEDSVFESIDNAIQKFNEGNKPYLVEIGKLKNQIQSQNSFIQIVHSRIGGIIKSQGVKNSSTNINENIIVGLDQIHDHNDELNRLTREKEETINDLRYEISQIFERIRLSIGETKIGHEKEIVKSIHIYLDRILDPVFSSNFMSSNEINNIFRSLDVNETKGPRSYLPAISQELLHLRHTLLILRPIETELSLLTSSIHEHELSHTNLSNLEKHIGELNTIMLKMTNCPSNQCFYNVIYQFLSLLQSLIIVK